MAAVLRDRLAQLGPGCPVLARPGHLSWSYRQATAVVRTIRRQSAVRSVTRPAQNGFPQSAVRSVTLRAGRESLLLRAAQTLQLGVQDVPFAAVLLPLPSRILGLLLVQHVRLMS